MEMRPVLQAAGRSLWGREGRAPFSPLSALNKFAFRPEGYIPAQIAARRLRAVISVIRERQNTSWKQPFSTMELSLPVSVAQA
jgi:hypothetical protein